MLAHLGFEQTFEILFNEGRIETNLNPLSKIINFSEIKML